MPGAARKSIGAALSLWLGSQCLIALLVAAQSTQAIKLSVSIPELVKLNDPFWLNCSVAHENRQLMASNRLQEIYAIKWYKDGEEFYKFLPNASPEVSIYETNGVQLDKSRSHEGNVLVSKADINSEGNYRCEILSEAPLFETVRKSKHVKVYALPVRGPRIELLDSAGRPKNFKTQDISYGVGDLIELRCNSAPSRPAARLRWYLNDHELHMPVNATSTSRKRRSTHHYKVGPVEHKLHYKSIYSSHTSLSLVLQQTDLIGNKISFKCVAAMKLEVPVVSKQLIVVLPNAGASARDRRQLEGPHEQRAQQYRHSMSRLTTLGSRQGPATAGNRALATAGDDKQEPISSRRNQMLYIYEEADSALGSSILDSQTSLDKYLRQAGAAQNGSLEINGTRMLLTSQPASTLAAAATTNYLESSRADNLELIQLLRESAGRQHKYPAAASSLPAQFATLKRANGVNFLARPPLYLDELDQLRPVISWPPLDSGRLLLSSSGNHLVAIPTWQQQQQPLLSQNADSIQGSSSAVTAIMLERIFNNLNCTCTEANTDTRLEWLLDERPLEARDQRNYPLRAHPSGEVRRQSSTIGFQTGNHNHAPQVSRSAHGAPPGGPWATLYSMFARLAANSSAIRAGDSLLSNQLEPATSENQLRIACQARHSVMVYSGSEMITFDFNPAPPGQQAGNSANDKLASSSNNVIQATSASQSSSASRTIKPTLLLSRSLAATLMGPMLTVLVVAATSANLYLPPTRNHCYL